MTLAFNKPGLLADNVGYESRNIRVGFSIENSLHYQIFRKMHGSDEGFMQIYADWFHDVILLFSSSHKCIDQFRLLCVKSSFLAN